MALLTRLRRMRSTSSGSAVRDAMPAAKGQRQALLERHRLEVQAQPGEQVLQAHRTGLHVHAAGVDARDVEQFAEQALEGVDALVDAVHQRRHFHVAGLWPRWRSASANRPIACSGWRRSWLAAAKNCVLARLAASAGAARLVGGRLLAPQLRGQVLAVLLQRRWPATARAVGSPHQERDGEQQRQHHAELPGARADASRWRRAPRWAAARSRRRRRTAPAATPATAPSPVHS
jgi:hypothetical protein